MSIAGLSIKNTNEVDVKLKASCAWLSVNVDVLLFECGDDW